MRVCSKCGSPDNGTGVCPNCHSTNFKNIGSQPRSFHDFNQYRGNYPNNQPNYYQQPPQQVVNHYHMMPSAPQSRIAGMAGAAAAGAAAGSKSAAKVVISIITSVAAVITAIIVPLIMANSSTPEKTLEKFETAYNDLDYNTMMECFDSTIRKAYDAGDDLLGGVLGFSYKSAADMMPFLSDAMGIDEEMPTMDLEIIDKEEVSETSCLIEVRMTMTQYGETESETETIEMVKEDGDWYISSDTLLDEF